MLFVCIDEIKKNKNIFKNDLTNSFYGCIMNSQAKQVTWSNHKNIFNKLRGKKDEKGLIHVLAGDKKTSLKQVPNRGYDTFENEIDAALDECEEMIYSCISSASRIGW